MRVLLVDDAERILLFRDSDLGLTPVPHWWITPGGGVDPGEQDRDAAVREIAEETGLVVSRDALVGPVATRTVVHGYSDVVTVQDEAFWLVRAQSFEVSTVGHTALEQLTMTAHRWWTRDELVGTAEEVWPRDLLRLWVLADDWPARGTSSGREPTGGTSTGGTSNGREPFDLGTVEESTVPA